MSENSQCVRPPALTEEELYFALDGITEPGTKQHLVDCGYCRNHLQELANFDKALQAPLYRFDCPDASKLSHYHLNLFLDEASRAQIALHLEKCVLCQRDLQILSDFLGEEAQVDEKVLQPDFQSSIADSKVILFPTLLPAPKRAVRGAESTAILARAGTTTIRIQLRQSNSEDNILNIQLSSSSVDWKEAMVILFQEGKVQAVQTMSQNFASDFKLTKLSPVTLHLIAQDKTFIEFKDVEVET